MAEISGAAGEGREVWDLSVKYVDCEALTERDDEVEDVDRIEIQRFG